MSELKDEFAKILSTQNEQHQKEITQLKVPFLGDKLSEKNHKLKVNF
jgi:hypothetical protein